MGTMQETPPRMGRLSTMTGTLGRLIATTQDAVIFIDSRGVIVEFNHSAEKMFEYDAPEIVGRNVSELMAEPYRSEHDGYLRHYQQTGQARAIGRIRTVKGQRKSGEVFPIELSVTEVPGDELVRYAAFLRDITEKQQAQQRLAERERLAALGTASAILAHEVGNPLNNLSMQAQLLGRRLENERDLKAIGRIMDEVRRLSRLLDEFRAASRRGTGAIVECDLTRIARYVVSHLQTDATACAVEMKVVQEAPVKARLMGSEDKLKQLLFNLCRNAIEAMPGGGALTLTLRTEGDLLILEVTDTGAGLPKNIDIFEPFKTTKAAGTGLGLAVVQQVVNSHHGSISWSSRPGLGTTFTITFPAVQ